jgi:hypothetical protein
VTDDSALDAGTLYGISVVRLQYFCFDSDLGDFDSAWISPVIVICNLLFLIFTVIYIITYPCAK